MRRGRTGGQVCEPKNFRERVIALVRRVERGRLVSYGQVARVLGSPRSARIVGGTLGSLSPTDRETPWQRVVNKQGGLSPRSDPFSDRDPVEEQADRLLAEGLERDLEGCYDLTRYGYTDDELDAMARMDD